MSNVAPKSKSSIILVIMSMAFGLVALLASMGGFSNASSEAGYHQTTGVIVDLDVIERDTNKQRTKYKCAPIADFQVDGQTYTNGPDLYSTYGGDEECKYSVGEEITVRYDPSDPFEATVASSSSNLVLGMIGGVIALLFGVIFPFRMISQSRKKTLVSD